MMERQTELGARWESWTALRVIVACVWLSLCAYGAFVLGSIGLLEGATFFGERPGTQRLLASAAWTVAAALTLAAGPFGVWLLRRTSHWLTATVVVGACAGLGATYLVVIAYADSGL